MHTSWSWGLCFINLKCLRQKAYLKSLLANKLNQTQANYINKTSLNKRKIILEMT